MIAAALMLLAQEGLQLPTTAAVTPAGVTVPSYDVECEMQDLDGRSFQLDFKQTGGRGYSQAAIRPGESGVSYTPVETVVTKDTSGRYAAAKLWTSGQAVWPGIKQTFPKAGEAFQTQFLSVATSKAGKVLLQVQSRYPLGDVSAFGICLVQPHDQSPMSDDEARGQVGK